MKKHVNYALLGCGMMGQEHLRNIALLDNATVVAFVEPDLAMRNKAQQLIPNADVYESLESLITHPGLDAVVIVTPNYQHADQLLYILKNSQLAILIEKPVITDITQVAAIKLAAAAHSAPIWVAMEYRYMPVIEQFKQRLIAGEVGELKMLTICEHRFPFLSKVADWNRFNSNTGGTLVEKCCHFFDLMRLLSNSEVVRVYASTGQDVNHKTERYAGQSPDIIDNAYVVLDFASGLRAMLELNMFAEGAQYQEQISAVGDQAKLECFVPGPGRFWPAALGAAPVAKLVKSPRAAKGPVTDYVEVDPTLLQAGDHNGSTYYQHLGFYQAIVAGAPVEVSVADGLKAVVIGLAAQHSAKTGQAVNIIENGYNYR
ncbi:MAG: Gfo/Idh/MocA family oxidoreductase [Oceanospirillaceae bacterium]|nr:Gfo/Idh/MocA family oxidoreductase [Oceanospirillaceae bacterium]